MKEITIIIPVYNGASTLDQVFKSLESQEDKYLIEEIICIDDSSKDVSLSLLNTFKENSSFKVTVIHNTKSQGLSANYNNGIHKAVTDFVILMHQDIVLTNKKSILNIYKPFLEEPSTIISYPYILHPYTTWRTYNFWQKILFARLVGTKNAKFTGKFDCIKITKEIFFDSKTYRTAGEDFDFEIRARKIGKVVQSDVEIIHVHNQDKNFSLSQLYKKEAQLAECYGVNLRKYHKETPLKDIILLMIRPILILPLLIPSKEGYLVSFVLITIFSILYTSRMYKEEYKDTRILILPIITSVTLIIYSYYFFKGFITKKQII